MTIVGWTVVFGPKLKGHGGNPKPRQTPSIPDNLGPSCPKAWQKPSFRSVSKPFHHKLSIPVCIRWPSEYRRIKNTVGPSKTCMYRMIPNTDSISRLFLCFEFTRFLYGTDCIYIRAGASSGPIVFCLCRPVCFLSAHFDSLVTPFYTPDQQFRFNPLQNLASPIITTTVFPSLTFITHLASIYPNFDTHGSGARVMH